MPSTAAPLVLVLPEDEVTRGKSRGRGRGQNGDHSLSRRIITSVQCVGNCKEGTDPAAWPALPPRGGLRYDSWPRTWERRAPAAHGPCTLGLWDSLLLVGLSAPPYPDRQKVLGKGVRTRPPGATMHTTCIY